MNPTITLASGSTLEVQIAPFSTGTKLYKTIANELKTVDVGGSLSLSQLGSLGLNDAKAAIFQLMGSDALEAAVFECMKFCLYNGEKISRATFEEVDARGDFLPCAWEVVKLNVSPFFKNLDLSSMVQGKPKSSGQR